MKIIKFVLFILSMLLIVILANFFEFSRQKKDNISDGSVTSLDSLITYEYGDVKSLASIYFNTKQDALAKLFNTDISNMQNTILKKDIKIENINAKLIVFFGMYRIEQITVLVEPNILSNADIAKMVDKIKSRTDLNVPADFEEIDNEDGNVVADITTYRASKYNFIITEHLENNELGFSIDLANNIYSYEQ